MDLVGRADVAGRERAGGADVVGPAERVLEELDCPRDNPKRAAVLVRRRLVVAELEEAVAAGSEPEDAVRPDEPEDVPVVAHDHVRVACV